MNVRPLNKISNKIYGVVLVAVIAALAFMIAEIPALKSLAISPLIVGIVLGMVFANTFGSKVPQQWMPGILFSGKTLLRLAIILYGFRITFQQIALVGLDGLIVSIVMLTGTMLVGIIVGIKLLKLDRDTTILVAAGSAVCGAAAVLATEDVLKSQPHKTAIAVATVVLFGTIGMFLYPVMYKAGLLEMDYTQYGLYVGASIHEVAQVVAASGAIDSTASDTAIIVKMIRVMMLAPMLLILGLFLISIKAGPTHAKTKLPVPWFAVFFIAVAGFNSLQLLPPQIVAGIIHFDTLLLTMAMTALGMETHVRKFRQAGWKPVLLALILFIWLVGAGGYTVIYLSAG
ncbi:UPF0324 inner membrane protein YeiH [hydrothermal vent metagenome]|uniref:UPF0324 inner membrane protein YeiH n=1 Tax=hydrothermal vent metagenome TaxID=652676 RepID=A0A3B0VBR9_9ZZZZ